MRLTCSCCVRFLAELAFDLLDGQGGEGAHRIEVARGQRPVRLVAEAAEAAVDAAVAEPQRHVEVRADRQRRGDRKRQRLGMIAGVDDQLGQPALQDPVAKGVFLRLGIAGLGRCGLVRIDVGELAAAVDEAGGEGDVHAQMDAHRLEDAVDRLIGRGLAGGAGEDVRQGVGHLAASFAAKAEAKVKVPLRPQRPRSGR